MVTELFLQGISDVTATLHTDRFHTLRGMISVIKDNRISPVITNGCMTTIIY